MNKFTKLVLCVVVAGLCLGGCSLLASPDNDNDNPPGFPTDPVLFTADLATAENGDYVVGLSTDDQGVFPLVDGHTSKWWFFANSVEKTAENPPIVTWELNGIVAGEYYVGIRLRTGDWPKDTNNYYHRLVDGTYSIFHNGQEIDIYSASEALIWEEADWGGGTVLAVAQSGNKLSLKNGDKISAVSYAENGVVFNLILYPQQVVRVWFASEQ